MTVTATGQPKYQQGYEPLPAGFDYVPYGDLEALREAMDEDVCCVFARAYSRGRRRSCSQ